MYAMETFSQLHSEGSLVSTVSITDAPVFTHRPHLIQLVDSRDGLIAHKPLFWGGVLLKIEYITKKDYITKNRIYY